MIDWELAAATARSLSPPGPCVPAGEARGAVRELRACARRASELIGGIAGLSAPWDERGVLVVDRSGWIGASTSSFAYLFDPVVEGLLTREKGRAPSRWARTAAARATAVEVGSLLGFLATRVLGQYEPAAGRPAAQARLLLVAPNVVETERRLGLHPADFRLWVCLHEETHRVQFSAVPWLREHVLGLQRDLVTGLTGTVGDLGPVLRELTGRLPRVLAPGGMGLGELVLDEPARERLLRINAVMALLEGHADVVMDAVSPVHVPSVATIRARFDARRRGLGMLDVVLRRLLGVEAKMAQYRDGAAFVRAVQARCGVAGFNRVWESPDLLPHVGELLEPERWLRRAGS